MTENTCLDALYRMGYHGRTTVHGIRGVASTVFKAHSFESDCIMRPFARVEGHASCAIANSAGRLPQGRHMMQWWADYLDSLLVEGDNVMPLALAS
jgi:hypothetical protein